MHKEGINNNKIDILAYLLIVESVRIDAVDTLLVSRVQRTLIMVTTLPIAIFNPMWCSCNNLCLVHHIVVHSLLIHSIFFRISEKIKADQSWK